MQVIKPYERGPQILRLLYEQGPLTINGLSKLLEPKMKIPNIETALARLRERKLIIRRNDCFAPFTGHFYQLSQRKSRLKELCNALKTDETTLERTLPDYVEPTHSCLCAFWAMKLKQLFPEAQVIRSHFFREHPEAYKLLSNEHINTRIAKPDILLIHPNENKTQFVTVVVEVIRTNKSWNRIQKKLRQYAALPEIDGFLYVGDQDEIQNIANDVFSQHAYRWGGSPKIL